MFSDPWLTRWLPLVAERAGSAPILEIGCGHGDDTVTLLRAGHPVRAFDLSRASVAAARLRAPAARIDCRDIRDPFPPEAQDLGVVVASLSLHYFSWQETLAIAARVRAVLRPGGVLLCRLNSTEDHHFGAAAGAPAGREIEPDYYDVDGLPKRFFDEAAVREMFAEGWNTLALEHLITRKYVKRKALWEGVFERVG